jgi:hypothetical protein
MKGQILSFLSLISLLVPSNASPIGAPDQEDNGKSDKLLGSSFGIPGNQTFDYVIVGGGTAGML